MDMSHALDPRLHLLRFTRTFATLIETGVSLMQALDTLKQMLPAPFPDIAAASMARIQAGATLADALRAYPEVFSRSYLALIDAGEGSGILDETMTFLAEMLEDEYRFLPAAQGCAALPERWEQLAPLQQQMVSLNFCHTFGWLLSAGVPTGLALETAADALPAAQQAPVRDIAQGEITAGFANALAGLGFLPPPILQLLTVGEMGAVLDFAMLKAARLYRYELRYATGLLGLSPQEAAPGRLAYAERLANGPIPIELATQELAFFTDALRAAGVAVGQEMPHDGHARMELLVERLLWLGCRRGAAAIELVRAFADGTPYARVSFTIGADNVEIRRMPPGMYDMLSYRLRIMADFEHPAQWFRPGEGTRPLTVADCPPAHVTALSYQHGGKMMVTFTDAPTSQAGDR